MKLVKKDKAITELNNEVVKKKLPLFFLVSKKLTNITISEK